MREIEFRDGARSVPDHVADMMDQIQTYTLTYDQAVKAMNNKLLSDRLADVQDRIVKEHFRELRK
jgi:hypothetical protein